MADRKTVKITDLRPYPQNPREGDIGAIVQSLETLGQYRPIVVNNRTGVDTEMTVLAGNHTLKAAEFLGWTEIAVTWVDVDDETAERIVLVDNRTNDLATYNSEVLSELLIELAETDTGLEGTGYDGDDLDLLLADLERASEPEEPLPKIEVPSDPVTKHGDVWQLGPHRLICGDAADPQVWKRLVDGHEPIAVAVTSPPYADRRSYDKKSGFQPIPPDDYVDWFEPIAANVGDHLAADGSWFVNIKAGVAPGGLDTEMYVLDLVIAHVRQWGWHFATEFCWERNGVPKSVSQRFKNQFEPVYQFTKNRWKMRPENVMHYSTDALTPFGPGIGDTGWGGDGGIPGQGREGSALPHHAKQRKTVPFSERQGLGGRGGALDLEGRSKRKGGVSGAAGESIQGQVTGSWGPGEYIGPGLAYPGNRLPTFSGSHEALGHAAAYPIGLPKFFIEAFTDLGDVTCDPMAGSGSSLIAAAETDRIGLAIEISPAYCDVIVKRWEDLHADNKASRA